jgi:hypothetical protein
VKKHTPSNFVNGAPFCQGFPAHGVLAKDAGGGGDSAKKPFYQEVQERWQ